LPVMDFAERMGHVQVEEVPVPVEEGEWRRETMSDGRTYFFNKVTGASQWHVPNDVYISRCLAKGDNECREPDNTIPPSAAKALMKVDCLTEVPAHSRKARQILKSVLQKVDAGFIKAGEDAGDNEVPPPKAILRVQMISARGLMDADFMPGADKSDPYCTCEVYGTPDVRLETEVIQDDLNPKWNHQEEILEGWEEGDLIMFRVFDKDVDDDQPLGHVVVDPAELNGKGPTELKLDEAGEDDDGDPCDAWVNVKMWIKPPRKVPSEEVSKRLQEELKKATRNNPLDKLIEKYDKDQSGSLNAEELRRVLRVELKIPSSIISDEDMGALIMALDDDGTGNLSGDELQDFVERGSATFYG